ncbi:MAG: hypothetical protein LIO70_04980, partial [Clostridiales bacterium]|nr:hypothetical protein [Clostridiales bacterium]
MAKAHMQGGNLKKLQSKIGKKRRNIRPNAAYTERGQRERILPLLPETLGGGPGLRPSARMWDTGRVPAAHPGGGCAAFAV